MTHSITLEITSRKAPPIPTTATLTRLLCLVSYFVQWNMVKPWWNPGECFHTSHTKWPKTSNCPDASQAVLSAAPGESGSESHVGTDRHLSERRLEETWVQLLKALRCSSLLKGFEGYQRPSHGSSQSYSQRIWTTERDHSSSLLKSSKTCSASLMASSLTLGPGRRHPSATISWRNDVVNLKIGSLESFGNDSRANRETL